MTGWNMPPGCNVSDIPGNRPEDEALEALMEDIFTILGMPDEPATWEIVEKLAHYCGEIYQDGYEMGAADERMGVLANKAQGPDAP